MEEDLKLELTPHLNLYFVLQWNTKLARSYYRKQSLSRWLWGDQLLHEDNEPREYNWNECLARKSWCYRIDSNRYIQSKDRSGLLKLTGRKIVGGTAVILNNPFKANPYTSNSVDQQLRVECNSILKVWSSTETNTLKQWVNWTLTVADVLQDKLSETLSCTYPIKTEAAIA